MGKKRKALKLLMLDEPMIWLTTVNGAAPVSGGQYTPPVTFAGTHNVDDPLIVCTLIGPMQSDSSPATVVNQSWSHTYDTLDAGSYVFVATIEGSSASTGPFPFFV